MESITDHIKITSRAITSPPHLKQRIMNHVTNQELLRDTTETASLQNLSRTSPYQQRVYWILSGTIIASVMFMVQTATPSANLAHMNIAEEIVAHYDTTSDESSTLTVLAYIDSLQTIQNLMYTDSVE